jgi:hypothetical protein
MRRRTAVAQHGTLPARQYRRQPASLGPQHPMPDRIDPTMKPTQPPGAHPMAHPALAQPQPTQVRQRHHPKLPLSQLRQRQIQGCAVFRTHDVR